MKNPVEAKGMNHYQVILFSNQQLPATLRFSRSNAYTSAFETTLPNRQVQLCREARPVHAGDAPQPAEAAAPDKERSAALSGSGGRAETAAEQPSSKPPARSSDRLPELLQHRDENLDQQN